MVNISQEKPPQYYSAPRRAPRQQSSLCATAASHSLLSSSWGSTPAPSRFQSCGQVSGVPLPFQLPNKRSISISWLKVKPYLYKLIWDARCGEISGELDVEKLASDDLLSCPAEPPPTLIQLSMKKGEDRSCLCLIWPKFQGKEESYQGIYISYLKNPPETCRQTWKK